jgi:hypothetical protein
LRRIALERFREHRGDYRGSRPNYIYCDTGADMHDYLARRRGRTFADLGASWWPDAVAHYHGVTRRQLRPWMRNSADVAASRAQAIARLTSHYGVRLPEV